MPTITHPFTFVNDTTSEANEVAQNLFLAGTTPSTGEVINGHLDDDNMTAPAPYVVRDHVQPGAFTKYGMVGSTHSTDYFKEPMQGWASQTVSDKQRQYLAIPGACKTFYLDFAVTALLYTWQIHYDNDDRANLNHEAYIRFMIGPDFDVYPAECRRRVAAGTLVDGTVSKWNLRQRHFSGHYLSLAPSVGWKSAGLYCAHEYMGYQLRIHVRNIKVFALL